MYLLMPKPNIYVVKFGGSLFRGPNYHSWLERLASWSQNKSIIVVPGGGKLVDDIRQLQQAIGCSDKTAHELALDAMRRQGQQLASALRLKISSVVSLTSHSNAQSPEHSIWVPSSQEFHYSGMPQNWSVSSDSIALWLATEIQCSAMLLLKSRAPAGSDPSMWAGEGYVDEYFPTLLKNLTCPLTALCDHNELR